MRNNYTSARAPLRINENSDILALALLRLIQKSPQKAVKAYVQPPLPKRKPELLLVFKPNKNAAFLKHLADEEDDLGPFKYYNFVVDKWTFQVIRYAGNPPGEYSVRVFAPISAAAQKAARDHLKIQLHQITWNAIKAQNVNAAEPRGSRKVKA